MSVLQTKLLTAPLTHLLRMVESTCGLPHCRSDPWSKYEDQLAAGDNDTLAALAANIGQANAAANLEALRARRADDPSQYEA